MGPRLRGDDTVKASYVRGPFTRLGMAAALIVCILDQATKLWLLFGFKLGAKGVVPVGPFFDLVLVWNKGISYGLFRQESATGRWGLILFALGASVAFAVWLARLESRLAAASIGLIIGGAIGNAIDRIAYGAVADFFSLHAFGHQWYVFNIADTAIVAGVVGLLYESLYRGHKKVGNPSKM